jgi:TetR/AcrR family tetracycline transcriptional repressor
MNKSNDHLPDVPRRSPNLEPEKVLTVAFQLLDDVGFGGLTLRRLADKLGVKAAALYWHFENKQDLVDKLAAKIIFDEYMRVKHKMLNTDWRKVLTITAAGLRDALLRYRDGALTIASADITHTNAIESHRFVLQRLQEEGIGLQLASNSLFAVTRYTLGCVFEEQYEPRHPEHVTSFDEGLEFVLDGVAQRVRKA